MIPILYILDEILSDQQSVNYLFLHLLRFVEGRGV